MVSLARVLDRLSICLAAGAFGAIINSLVVWYFGRKGIPQRFGVTIAPALSAGFLYPRLVWGGIWGVLFSVPLWRDGFWTGVFSRGILFSLLPTLFQLFYVFPVLMGKGMMGAGFGKLTPVFVCFYNAVWGFSAALWLYAARRQ